MVDMMNVNKIVGNVIKQNDNYTVIENSQLETLIIRSTDLRPRKSTNGHFHKGKEEIYLIVGGNGQMELDDKMFNIRIGDMICIPDGSFHRVHAGDVGCYFVCISNGGKKD